MAPISRGRAPAAEKSGRYESRWGQSARPQNPLLEVASRGGLTEWRAVEDLRRRFGELSASSSEAQFYQRRFHSGFPRDSGAAANGLRSAWEALRLGFEAWRGGPHGAPLLMGLGFFLGKKGEGSAGTRWEGELLRLREGFPAEFGPWKAELARQGERLLLKNLPLGGPVQVWRFGRWHGVAPGHSEELSNGDIFALGQPPDRAAIQRGHRSSEWPQSRIFRVESVFEPDLVRVTELKPHSLEFFLLEVLPQNGEPVFETDAKSRESHRPEKTFREALGLTFKFGLSKTMARIRIAERFSEQGHYEAAEREFEIARRELTDLWEGELAKRRKAGSDLRSRPDSRLLRTRDEAEILRVYGELSLARGLGLEWSQRPEEAAAAYAQAADLLYPLTSQASRHELAAYRAYKLYFRSAEAHLLSEKYAPAADAFEQAARFATVARVFSQRSSPMPRMKPEDPIRLLERAVICLLRAGPHFREPMERMQRKLDALRGQSGMRW